GICECGEFKYNDNPCAVLDDDDIPFNPDLPGFTRSLSGDVLVETGEVVRDFSGAENIDVVAAYVNEMSLVVYQGNGKGMLRPVNFVGLESEPTAITLCDFDDDSYMDAAVTLRNGKLFICHSTGEGYFSDNIDTLLLHESEISADPVDIAVIDIDDDDKDDLIVANNGTQTISIIKHSLEQSSFQMTYAGIERKEGNEEYEKAAPVALVVGNFVDDTGAIEDDFLVATEGGTVELFMMSGDVAVIAGYYGAANVVEDVVNERIVDMVTGHFTGTLFSDVAILVAGADPDLYLSGSYVHIMRSTPDDATNYLSSAQELEVTAGSTPVVLITGEFANSDGDLIVGDENCRIELFLQDSPGMFRNVLIETLPSQFGLVKLTDLASGFLSTSGPMSVAGEDLVIGTSLYIVVLENDMTLR
ncbi:MAG: hypothetical protein KOO63_12960, partial [Bacteroidales bacterium]|nr:hypothetical protein [Candidatus Latescibacterota bacterium]